MYDMKTNISARVPDWMKIILINGAKNNDRNLSQEVVNRIRQTLTDEEKKIANIQ